MNINILTSNYITKIDICLSTFFSYIVVKFIEPFLIFMKNSKLIELLSTFSKGEMRQLHDFVASPFFNKNEELLPFVAYLHQIAPNFAEKAIQKEVVYQKLYPGTPFDQKKISYLMNYLLKLAEQFLGVNHYLAKPPLVQCHILDEMVSRKLEKHYSYLRKKTTRELAEVTQKDSETFYYDYLVSDIAVRHFYTQRVRKFDPTLQYTSDKLDAFYFLQKLKYSCEMINRQSIVSAEYQLSFVDEVTEYILKQEDTPPLILAYLYILLTFSEPDEEKHFNQLMVLIKTSSHQFAQASRREVYLYALNYCARKIRKGQQEYRRIMLRLYREGINNKALYDGRYLSHWTFNNVVKLALPLEDYDWIASFIQDYSESLAPQFREDAQHFNLAELYYHNGEFGEVLEHLSQLHFTDIHYHLGSRAILLKTYYETDNIEPLLSLLASFSVYLRRNKKISQTLKKTYLNFCNLLHQILRNNPNKRDQLLQEIKSTDPLAERSWLVEKWNKAGERASS